MPGRPAPLAPSVAAVRRAVREALSAGARLGSGPQRRTGAARRDDQHHGDAAPLVLVACSGGADSLALAAATAFVAPRLGWRAGLVTVDHRLQPGSEAQAEKVAVWARGAGLAPVEAVPVEVTGRRGGPEAAARQARYAALADAAVRHGAAAIALGHTRDDQAETVLLALGRGAGPRGLAGMPARRDTGAVAWLRPLLAVTREETGQACRALGLDPWPDPHNADPSYARVRVRTGALPALVDALGARVVDNLARTAAQLAHDNAVLDALATGALAAARTPDGALAVAALAGHPEAVRSRALHAWLRELGVPGSALSHRHVAALESLVTGWHGQGPASLPGGLTVRRRAGLLLAAGGADRADRGGPP
jgi:tRNA(Ile)-lysidine synthase